MLKYESSDPFSWNSKTIHISIALSTEFCRFLAETRVKLTEKVISQELENIRVTENTRTVHGYLPVVGMLIAGDQHLHSHHLTLPTGSVDLKIENFIVELRFWPQSIDLDVISSFCF